MLSLSFARSRTVQLLQSCKWMSTIESQGMELNKVVKKLEEFASPSLAGSWDNVGLLLEPSGSKMVNKIFITNDLTEPVLREAVEANSDMILSYHPPIFRPFKRLTQKSWKERIIIEMLERRMALYSPHTAWDAVQGGINDWLLIPFGGGDIKPAEPSSGSKSEGDTRYSVSIERGTLKSGPLLDLLCLSNNLTIDESAINLNCSEANASSILEKLPESLKGSAKVVKHEPTELSKTGAGRILKLDQPLSLSDVLERTKDHLRLSHVRLALGNGVSKDSMVHSMAVCAGSGASVIGNLAVDLLLTGEMSHHEVLDCVHRGTSVILTDHSNTERGYHSYIREKLMTLFENKIEIIVTKVDRDPLQVV